MEERFDLLSHLGEGESLQEIVDAIPYARFLGIGVAEEGDTPLFVLRYSEDLVGNVLLPALHGGVTGAFLETVALVTLVQRIDSRYLPKTIDISFEYLRSGRPRDTYARAVITKHGRRVANVRVEAWQDDEARPIAAAHGHFLIKPRQG